LQNYYIFISWNITI